ncbi:hypothetical protein [Hymenobacter glacieicola]|uniref:Outer membrane protein beta-barrel domain-containing protein n=1 Tax=Hymenobacter glacieicola TaxID=1562124 RepID=A0ABQ1WKN7_9BACT|nr:hypothetical protein [Hymenobacter glacieicola]GGG32678.1 hypothetical protein GCM10011378_06360 [Hymenobacter glacieicola]
MPKALLLVLLAAPLSPALAQSSPASLPRTTVLVGGGRALQTNYGWPGTVVFLGVEHRLSPRSLFSVQPRLSAFRADTRSLEPDKQPGEQYATAGAEALVAVRTSRRPERVALRLEAGPAFFLGRETKLYRYPGTYLNPDGTTTTLRENEYRRRAIRQPGFSLGLGLDATLHQRIYLGASLESRTYSYFPGDILSATARVGYVLP